MKVEFKLMLLLNELWVSRGHYERFWQFIHNVQHEFYSEIYGNLPVDGEIDLYNVHDPVFCNWLQKKVDSLRERSE